jgi:hypothetical protein
VSAVPEADHRNNAGLRVSGSKRNGKRSAACSVVRRILFVTASSTVYRYAQRSAHPIRWVMATGVMFELGMGVGSVLATVIEGPAGAVALAGGLLLYVIVSSV